MVVAAMGALVSGATFAGTPAHAGGSTVTGVSNPQAVAILTAARVAERHVRSARVKLWLRLTIPGRGQLRAFGAGDAALNPLRVHETLTLRVPPLMATAGVELVYLNGRIATRSGMSPWQCANSLGGIGQYLKVAPVLPPRAMEVVGAHIGNASLLGTAIIRGVRTWHVRVTADTVVKGRTVSALNDFYIGQSDHLAWRVVSTIAVPVSSTVTGMEHLVLNLSHYGEPVTVQLPASCG
jgi:hypothetical protein